MSKREKLLVVVVGIGFFLLSLHSGAYAAASRGGEEGMWWILKLLGIPYN